MTKKYDTDKIKNIDIFDWMLKNGYKQGKGMTGKYRSFYSPFNSEGNASMKVNTANNTFHCYSYGKGGDIITLVQEIEKCSFVRACEILDSNASIEIETFKKKEQPSGTIIHTNTEPRDKQLISMLVDKRKIGYDLVMKYCVELLISFPLGVNPDQKHRVIGMMNDMKGFDYRGLESWLKLSTAPKCFTTIKGRVNSNIVLVFEGFLDFLSYLTHYGIDTPKHKTYVLNGLGMFNVLKPMISDKEIHLWIDNDIPSDNLIKENSDLNLKDKRFNYQFYKDVNDFIIG